MPALMTPHSFAARYLNGQKIETRDGGLLATCPACHTVNAFRIDADADGAYVACSGRLDSESPCNATDFAAALDLDVEEWCALLESVRSASTATAPKSLKGNVLRRSDLANLPELEPLIAHTVLRRTLTFVAGPPASGKSFHLLSWAASVATGTPWRDRAVDKGRVLYVIAEGAYGVDDRLAAWESYHGKTIPDDAFDTLTEAVQLTDPAALDELVALITKRDYDLVIIDTLSRSIVGHEENSQASMSLVIAAADRLLAAMTNGALVIAHHSSKAGAGLRGSSVLEGAADSVYVTSKGHAEDSGAYWLARAKNKHGAEDDFLAFAWHAEGDSGLLVEPNRTTRAEPKRDRFASEATWTVLLNGLAHGQTFTRAEAWRIVSETETVKRASFYNHWTDLVGRGAITLFASESGRSADYFRLDLPEAKRLGFCIERFNPLEEYAEDFLAVVSRPA